MNKSSLTLLACIFPLLSSADPVVTISCDIPKGTSMEYGESSSARVQSAMDKKPVPKPSLIVAKGDGYEERPTFTVNSTKKRLFVTWAESEDELKQRQQAKKVGIPHCCSPNPKSAAEIVMFTPDNISAIEITPPYVVTVYSFFPKLGTMFVSDQGTDVFGKNSSQHAFFATCTYSWGNPKSVP